MCKGPEAEESLAPTLNQERGNEAGLKEGHREQVGMRQEEWAER